MTQKDAFWKRAVLPPNSTIQDAIRNLNDVSIRITLVLDEDGRLLGTISDGDIRRALLKGLDLNSPIATVVHRNALVVPPEWGRETVMQLMVANKIQQIPVVNADHYVVGLHLWEEITTQPDRTNLMVIMAGGKGTRLRPHTENCPKPMLPVAGKPMLEHIIDRAKNDGFKHFIIAIHYLGHMIQDYFGNGQKFGVQIDYLSEDYPLGTAGALSLINPQPESPFIVTNGDVITDISYGELLDFHIRNNVPATMAVRIHEWQNPFGVVKIEGLNIVGFEEKPIIRSHINAGVYALDHTALKMLKSDEYCDMPNLFQRLHDNAGRIMAYPMHEPWLDVGRVEDLKQANIEMNK